MWEERARIEKALSWAVEMYGQRVTTQQDPTRDISTVLYTIHKLYVWARMQCITAQQMSHTSWNAASCLITHASSHIITHCAHQVLRKHHTSCIMHSIHTPYITYHACNVMYLIDIRHTAAYTSCITHHALHKYHTCRNVFHIMYIINIMHSISCSSCVPCIYKHHAFHIIHYISRIY